MDQTDSDVPSAQQDQPEFDEAMIGVALEGFRGEQGLLGGVLAGLAAALAGAGLWAAITVVTGYQIGWMAVGVGFLVGIAVRLVGKGIDKTFGVAGALLALLGCLLGNVLTVVHFVAQAEELGYLETLTRLRLSAIPELLIATFSPIDLLFYGIAIYEGYKLSFRRIAYDELERAIKGPSAEESQP
jgi:hypothetical protein